MFDYNLGDELDLDESRNARKWDVDYAIAHALREATPEQLATILMALIANPDLYEGTLNASYLGQNNYEETEIKERRKKSFTKAWQAVAGDEGVVIDPNSKATSHFVAEKGYNPVVVPTVWAQALSSYEVPSQTSVLTKSEQEGKVTLEATEEMKAAVAQVWNVLETFQLTNGKAMPGVKGFYSILDGGAQLWGYWMPGSTEVCIHKDLTGPMLLKCALEEVAHYVTEATDNSRDFQDFLMRVIIAMAF